MSFCCTSFSHKLRMWKLVSSIVHLNTRFLNYCNLQVFQKDLLWRSWFLVFIICTDQLNICRLLRLLNPQFHINNHTINKYEPIVMLTQTNNIWGICQCDSNPTAKWSVDICVYALFWQKIIKCLMWLYKPYLFCHNQRIFNSINRDALSS